MGIEEILVLGFFAGLAVGLATGSHRFGCMILLGVPIAMIFYVSWWQNANPDSLRSTSGLDFVFGPLWPSIGAIVGYYSGRLVRRWVLKT